METHQSSPGNVQSFQPITWLLLLTIQPVKRCMWSSDEYAIFNTNKNSLKHATSTSYEKQTWNISEKWLHQVTGTSVSYLLTYTYTKIN